MGTTMDEAKRAWGLIYSHDRSVPDLYLTERAVLLLKYPHEESVQFEIENRKGPRKLVRKSKQPAKLLKLSRKDLKDDDFGVKIKVLGDQSVETSGKELSDKRLIRDRTTVTLPDMDLAFEFEAFCDESRDATLSGLSRDYRVTELLRVGSFGKLYRAYSVHRRNFCAVMAEEKEGERERMRTEFECIGKLTHPGLVRCFELMQSDTHFFMSLELLEAETWKEHLGKGATYDEKSARDLISQLLDVADFVHRNHVVHRDVKPANVLIMGDGKSIKLSNFGQACREHDADEMTRVVGTVRFMAPDVLYNMVRHGKRRYTNKIDVWSIGVCLFFALAQALPFKFEGDPDLLLRREIINRKLRVNEPGYQKLSEQCKDVISRCLELNFTERPSCSELLQMEWFHMDLSFIEEQNEEEQKVYEELNLEAAKSEYSKEAEETVVSEELIDIEVDIKVQEEEKEEEIKAEVQIPVARRPMHREERNELQGYRERL